MNDMNDNKTWQVTLQLAVVAVEDPIDDDAFFHKICEFIGDDYDMCSSVEGAILIGVEAVELEARSYTLKTEPATEPVAEPVTELVTEPAVLGPPPSTEQPTYRSNGKRDWRIRVSSGLREFVYYSSDYRNASKQLDIGTPRTRGKRACVWLTEDEVAEVCALVMEKRAQRVARRAAKGGE